MGRGKTRRFSVVMDEGVVEELDEILKDSGFKRSEFISTMLAGFCVQYDLEKDDVVNDGYGLGKRGHILHILKRFFPGVED